MTKAAHCPLQNKVNASLSHCSIENAIKSMKRNTCMHSWICKQELLLEELAKFQSPVSKSTYFEMCFKKALF